MNIHDIAREAGVSIATVSRVINGKKDVSDRTRKRITDIIRRENYKPRFTVTSSVDSIAVIIATGKLSSPYGNLYSPYVSMLLEGISGILFPKQINVVLLHSPHIPHNSQEFIHYCRQRQISGAIFLNSTVDDHYLSELGQHFPIVTVGNDLTSEHVGSVRSDNEEGAYKAVHYLTQTGHRRIQLIMADMHYVDHRDRYRGACRAIADADAQLHPATIEDSFALTDQDLAFALRHTMAHDRPDAIFAGGDHEAVRVLRILNDLNYTVPDDVSVVGYDNLPFASVTQPPLTTVNHPIQKIGAEAAKMLLDMAGPQQIPPSHLVLQDNALLIRASVKHP